MPQRAEAASAPERIAKRLARAGVCSRREAERMIAEGRVAVDGTVLTTPATLVDERSRITVDGRRIGAAEATRLWRYHKPPGLICTNRDPRGRPTIFETLPDGLPRLISVGRLDFGSEGLLLLTNDGEVAARLERGPWVRRYRVRAFGTVDDAALAALANGPTVEGIRYGAIEARLDSAKGRNVWLTVALREGRNREVRIVLEHVGLVVNRLIRIAYGPFQLGGLARGAIDEVPAKALAEQLGNANRRR